MSKIVCGSPNCFYFLRVAIPAGIGLFIALLGFQNAGIVVSSETTCVDLASFNILKGSWGDIMLLVVTIVTTSLALYGRYV